jgi:hypothetical protein
MLMQRCMNRVPHWIEDEVYTFASGEFRSRYKIRIPGHKNYLIHLLFERQRGNVKANAHIYTLLRRHVFKIVIL